MEKHNTSQIKPDQTGLLLKSLLASFDSFFFFFHYNLINVSFNQICLQRIRQFMVCYTGQATTSAGCCSSENRNPSSKSPLPASPPHGLNKNGETQPGRPFLGINGSSWQLLVLFCCCRKPLDVKKRPVGKSTPKKAREGQQGGTGPARRTHSCTLKVTLQKRAFFFSLLRLRPLQSRARGPGPRGGGVTGRLQNQTISGRSAAAAVNI